MVGQYYFPPLDTVAYSEKSITPKKKNKKLTVNTNGRFRFRLDLLTLTHPVPPLPLNMPLLFRVESNCALPTENISRLQHCLEILIKKKHGNSGVLISEY